MSQMFVIIKVEFIDDGISAFAEHRMKAFEPLADHKLDREVAIGMTLDALGKSGETRDRMRHILELWEEKYLRMQELQKISPYEYDMVFVSGRMGQHFAVDFANMFATYQGVSRVQINIWSSDYLYDEEEGIEYGLELEILPEKRWRKFPVED